MTIIDALIPSASSDVVAIFPEIQGTNIFGLVEVPGFIPAQVFEAAKPMKVLVSEPSKYMVHPLENGEEVTDHRIILPVEITINFVFEADSYRNTYLLIRQSYLLGLRFSIQTKTNTYTGMYISDIPHEEDPGFFDTITMVIKFREVQFFRTQEQVLSDNDVVDPTDASTIEIGEQIPTTANENQNNSGSILFNTFGSFF